MKKSLVREVKFGRAVARVTVSMFTEKKYFDGIDTGEYNVVDLSDVEVVVDGKVVSSGFSAKILEYGPITDTFYHKAKLDPSKKYSRVGDKAITLGDEDGLAINQAIAEMKAELSAEFGVETEAEKEAKAELEYAQEVVAQAEKEGIENLMNDTELKAWRERYNALYNEGGEGFIPGKVSREQYRKALSILSDSGVV